MPLGLGTPWPRVAHVVPPSVDKNTVLTVMPDTMPVLATMMVEPSLLTENALIDELVNQVDPSVVVIGSAFQLSPPLLLRHSRWLLVYIVAGFTGSTSRLDRNGTTSPLSKGGVIWV